MKILNKLTTITWIVSVLTSVYASKSDDSCCKTYQNITTSISNCSENDQSAIENKYMYDVTIKTNDKNLFVITYEFNTDIDITNGLTGELVNYFVDQKDRNVVKFYASDLAISENIRDKNLTKDNGQQYADSIEMEFIYMTLGTFTNGSHKNNLFGSYPEEDLAHLALFDTLIQICGVEINKQYMWDQF